VTVRGKGYVFQEFQGGFRGVFRRGFGGGFGGVSGGFRSFRGCFGGGFGGVSGGVSGVYMRQHRRFVARLVSEHCLPGPGQLAFLLLQRLGVRVKG
jgi:hypothetical protein